MLKHELEFQIKGETSESKWWGRERKTKKEITEKF